MSVDVGAVDLAARFLDVEPSTLSPLSETLLDHIANKSREFSDLKASVEAGTASQGPDPRIDKLEKELANVKDAEIKALAQKQIEETEKARLSHEVAALTDRQRKLESEAGSLRQQAGLLDQNKRDLLESLDRRQVENRELRMELSVVHEARSTLRQKVNELEAEALTHGSELIQATSREELLRLENERKESDIKWLNDELKRTQESTAKTRHSLLEQTSQLRTELESSEANGKALRQSYELLKDSYAQLTLKYDQTTIKVERLRRDQIESEDKFESEMSGLKRLVEVADASSQEQKEVAKSLEHELVAIRAESESTIDDLRKMLENEQSLTQKLQADLDSAEEKLCGLLDATASETHPDNSFSLSSTSFGNASVSRANVSSSFATPAKSAPSPSARVLSELHRKGGSVVDLMNSYNATKLESERWKQKHDILRRDMDRVLQELELNTPALVAEREEYERVVEELANVSKHADSETKKMKSLERTNRQLEQRVSDLITEQDLAGQQIGDLSHQVRHLLINAQLAVDGESPMTAREKASLAKLLESETESGSDTDRLISQRMTLFKDVSELQQQNEQLLKACRSLGRRLESEENSKSKNDVSSVALSEAKQTLELLQAKIRSLNSQLEAVSHERDVFRDLATKKGEIDEPTSPIRIDSAVILREKETLLVQLEQSRSDADQLRQEVKEALIVQNQKTVDMETSYREMSAKLAQSDAKLELVNEQKSVLEESLKVAKFEHSELKINIAHLQETLAGQTQAAKLTQTELLEIKTSTELLRNNLSRLEAEKQLWKSQETKLVVENTKTLESLQQLKAEYASLQSREKDREVLHQESEKRFFAQIDVLQRQLGDSESRLGVARDEYKVMSSRREADNLAAQDKISNLKETVSKLQQNLSAADANRDLLDSKLKDLQARLESRSSSQNTEETARENAVKLQGELDVTQKELKVAQHQIVELRRSLEDASHEATLLETKHADENKTLLSTLSAKDETLQILEKELQEQKTQLENSMSSEESTKLRELVQKLEADISVLQNTNEKLRSDIATKSETLTTVEKEQAVQQSQNDELLRERTLLSQRLNLLQDQVKAQLAQRDDHLAQAEQQKQAYDARIEELQGRLDELALQNKKLLENFTTERSQVTELDGESQTPGFQNGGNAFIVDYLRREKEIAEIDLQSCQQSLRHVEQDLAHTTERLTVLAASHKTLQEAHRQSKLEEISLTEKTAELSDLKEQNLSLAAELKSHTETVSSLKRALDTAREQQAPIQQELETTRRELEHHQMRVKLLEQDNERWKERLQSSVSGNNFSDDLENLQKELQAKEVSLANLKSEAQEKLNRGRVEKRKLQEEVSTLRSSVDNLTQQVKEQKAIAEAATALSGHQDTASTTDEVTEDLKLKIQSLQEELISKDDRISFLENEVNKVSDELIEAQNAAEEASESATLAQQLGHDIETLNREKEQLANTKQRAAEADSLKEKVRELEAHGQNFSTELGHLRDKLAQTESSLTEARSQLAVESNGAFEANIDSEDTDFVALKQELVDRASQEQIDQFSSKVALLTQASIKAKSHEFIKMKVDQLTGVKDQEIQELRRKLEVADSQLSNAESASKSTKQIEETLEKKFDLKQKLLRNKVASLEATNKELSLTVRKLKGGVDVAVTTLPTGVTKVLENAPGNDESVRNKGGKTSTQYDMEHKPPIFRQAKGSKAAKRPNNESQSQPKKRKEDP